MKWILLPILTALVVAPASLAAPSGYDRISFAEPSSEGLAVKPPLEEFVAVARARTIVPRDWRRLRSKPSRPVFMTRGGTCRFRVTWSVRTRVVDAPGEAEALLASALAVPARGHVYERGERNGRPFRVVKVSGGSATTVRGAWVGVLTRRRDVAPEGKAVWGEIVATARGIGECHSGTIHNVARAIADGLAVASADLAFVKPG